MNPPSTLHVIAERIPIEMKRRRQWVAWKLEERDGKATKVPYSPRTGRKASSTDSLTWGTFEDALEALDRFDGVGFVFSSGDPYAGVDLDGCVDPETGEVEAWASKIVDALDSYAELSPSGTGLHIIVRGKPPANGKRGRVEMYDSGRYFTMTGSVHGGRTEVSPQTRTDVLARLHAEHVAAPNRDADPRNGTSGSNPANGTALELTDGEVLELCRGARNAYKFTRLYDLGDTTEYGGDDSSADLALLGVISFYTQDPDQLDRLFRGSALCREKWTGRPDYRRRTISKALSDVRETYTRSRDATRNGQHARGGAARGPTREAGGDAGGIGRHDDEPITPSAPWPTLKDEALHSLAGDLVRAVDPHTEADPVAVLVNFIAAFGNAIGRGAHARIGPDFHYLKVFAGLIGVTSKGRKGTSWGPVRDQMKDADADWAGGRVLGGLSSGEGLIYAVRDRVMGLDKNGEEKIVDEGAEDKRLLIVESELSGVLKVMSREGNTLSPVVRQAWDDTRLQVLTKNSPMKATDSHISIIGHITKAELLRHLTETETANGFANRFLWLMVKRSKLLPRGGEWWKVNKQDLTGRIRKALEFGRGHNVIEWGASAGAAWDEIYGSLSEGKPGMFGAVVGRGEAQVLRLAALYAVLDLSHTIEDEHLAAALALWDYAEASARYIFGDATGDPVADQIAEALKIAGSNGMSRTDLRDYFGRNKKAERINQALALLLNAGRARREQKDTGGRPVEVWFAK